MMTLFWTPYDGGRDDILIRNEKCRVGFSLPYKEQLLK